MRFSGIGGQAVLEGVMMRNRNKYSVAVRKKDGRIDSMTKETVPFSDRHKWAKWPFVRGVVSLFSSLKLGMETLMWSSSYEDENGEEQSFTGGQMAGTVIFAVVLALGIFVVLPMIFGNLLRNAGVPEWLSKILEGVLRLAIFIAYVSLTSLMKDIKRTYMYHGAEHKCINCLEHGLPLTVENVMNSSREHRRCGTSFMLLVMLISIIIFVLVPLPKVDLPENVFLGNVLTRLSGFGIRLALIPVVAGLSFELIQFTGRHDNLFSRIISRPGMWMQALTTREPEPDMVEVAITAVENVFDWRAFLKENFNVDVPYPEKEAPPEDAAEESLAKPED